MHEYQTKGCGPSGADMGRASDLPFDTDAICRVRHVPLVDGYDPGGAYWGNPNDLWCVSSTITSASEKVDVLTRYLRAPDLATVKGKFPNAQWATETVLDVGEADIADLADAYVDAALDDLNRDEDSPRSDYLLHDLDAATLTSMRAEAEQFATEHAALLVTATARPGPYPRKQPNDYALAGYHFWHQRNGAGVGFEDGDWPEPEAKALAAAARETGRTGLYVGDDGKVYAH